MDAHHHDADHDRREGPTGSSAAFAVSIALNVLYLAAEIVCGIVFNSIALVADAVHNLSDVLGLALAWWTESLARRRPTPERTYGFRKSTVLAALANTVLIYAAVGGIAVEAATRLFQPRPASGLAVLVMASLGVVVNGASALILLHRTRRREDLNLRAAFLHLVADAAVSLGVAAAGLAIMASGLAWIDPVVSLAVSAVIAVGTWSILRRALDLALDAVPAHIDLEAVRGCLLGLPGVCGVHDLHIWAMSTTETALTAHLMAGRAGSGVPSPREIAAELEKRFGIGHATLQIETGDDAGACPQGGDTAV
jgi:cobalt-zinc-cadmium efflux system protein